MAIDSSNGKEMATAQIEKIKKANYFIALTLKYLPEMRLLLKGGKLVRKYENGKTLPAGDRGRWINVLEHCLVMAAAAEELAKATGMSPEKTTKLAKAAAIHDWDKRFSKKPQDFTEQDIKQIEKLLAKAKADPKLKTATDPSVIKRFIVDGERMTLEQRLLFYLDTITEESDIVPFEPRLKEAKKRWPSLGEDDGLNAQIADKLGPGKGYWEAAAQISGRVQKEIFYVLNEHGFNLQSPSDVPAFIKSSIEKNYK